MNNATSTYYRAFEDLKKLILAEPGTLKQAEYSGALLFAASDILMNVVGPKLALDALSRIVDSIEARVDK